MCSRRQKLKEHISSWKERKEGRREGDIRHVRKIQTRRIFPPRLGLKQIKTNIVTERIYVFYRSCKCVIKDRIDVQRLRASMYDVDSDTAFAEM